MAVPVVGPTANLEVTFGVHNVLNLGNDLCCFHPRTGTSISSSRISSPISLMGDRWTHPITFLWLAKALIWRSVRPLNHSPRRLISLAIWFFELFFAMSFIPFLFEFFDTFPQMELHNAGVLPHEIE